MHLVVEKCSRKIKTVISVLEKFDILNVLLTLKFAFVTRKKQFLILKM